MTDLTPREQLKALALEYAEGHTAVTSRDVARGLLDTHPTLVSRYLQENSANILTTLVSDFLKHYRQSVLEAATAVFHEKPQAPAGARLRDAIKQSSRRTAEDLRDALVERVLTARYAVSTEAGELWIPLGEMRRVHLNGVATRYESQAERHLSIVKGLRCLAENLPDDDATVATLPPTLIRQVAVDHLA